jgi:hypothetical protein
VSAAEEEEVTYAIKTAQPGSEFAGPSHRAINCWRRLRASPGRTHNRAQWRAESNHRLVPALIRALGDPEKEVAAQAANSLHLITGQDFGQDAARWQQWWAEQQK